MFFILTCALPSTLSLYSFRLIYQALVNGKQTMNKPILRALSLKQFRTAALASVLLSATLIPLQTAQADSGGWWGHHDDDDRQRHHRGRYGGMGGYGGMGYGMMGGYGHMGFGMAGMMPGMGLYDLDLNRSQREKMQEIMESHHDSLKDQFKAQQNSHYEFMEALLDGANGKELNRILEKQNQQSSQHQKAHIEMMQQLMSVLTDEQKAELKKRLQ